jgi:aminoglycoside phosphotransferase (APT) family kinase protein
VRAVGPLLASGRDADVFEYGPGLVLRRTKHGRVLELEARTMRYVAEAGFPLPRVEDVIDGGTAIVMERIDGPLMMDTMARRPYSLRHHARMLADLHDQLHCIPAPEWVPRTGGGEQLVHLDLHPLNVIMAARGPVVIDWTNASAGDPLLDVALTYVLITCPEAPVPALVRPLLEPLRRALGRAFVGRYRGAALDAQIVVAAELKMLDPNLSAGEVARCGRLAHRTRSSG